jgi:hypothetical protein
MKRTAYALWVIAAMVMAFSVLSGAFSDTDHGSTTPTFIPNVHDTKAESAFLEDFKSSYLPPINKTDTELIELGNAWCYAIGLGMGSEDVEARINEGSDDEGDAVLQRSVVSSAIITLCPGQASKWP